MTDNELKNLLRKTHFTLAGFRKVHLEFADQVLALSLSETGKRLARTVREVPDVHSGCTEGSMTMTENFLTERVCAALSAK